MDLALLSRAPEMRGLPPRSLRVVRAMRHWVVARRKGACPAAALHAQIGSARAAGRLHLLLEEIGAAWPEPFAVGPPCCALLSHDEASLAAMLDHAARGDRLGFDRQLQDLLGPDEREHLFHSARELVDALPD